MPIDPSIPLGVQQPQIIDPMAIMGRVQQMRDLQQRGVMQQQQIALGQQQLAGAQRQQADLDAVDNAFANGTDRDSILANVPGHLRGSVAKQFAESDEAAIKAKKAKADADDAEKDYFGSLAYGVKQWLPMGQEQALGAAKIALQHAAEKGYPDAEQTWNQIQAHPEALPQIVEQLISQSKTYSTLNEGARHNLVSEDQAKAAAAATQARFEAQQKDKDADNARQDAAQKSLDNYRKASLANEAAKNTQSAKDVTALTPEGIRLAAKNFLKTGQLPPLGNGDHVTRQTIINLAAQMDPEADIASNKADYASNKASLAAIQKQRDAMGAFEETAGKNLRVFLDAAGKVVDSGSPLLNRPLRSFSENVLGSPDMAAFNTARRTVIPEFAKILANPGLSGQLSDSARHEVEQVVSGNASLRQIVAAAKVLTTDVVNRTKAYDDQIGAIRSRLSGGVPDAGAPKADPLGIR